VLSQMLAGTNYILLLALFSQMGTQKGAGLAQGPDLRLQRSQPQLAIPECQRLTGMFLPRVNVTLFPFLTESSFWYCRHLRDSERSIPTSAQTQNAQTQWNLQNSQNSSIPGSPCFQTHQTYHTPCALLHPGCDSIGCACTPPLTRTPLPMGGFSSKERTEQGHLHRETKADSPLFSSDLR